MSLVSQVTLVPAEFTLVKFDADQVRGYIAEMIAAVKLSSDVSVTVEVDEVLPHPLTASTVEIIDGSVVLWFTGGCFESPQRQTGLSPENTRVELGTSLFRALDRLSPAFADAPSDEDLDERQRTIWDTYAEGRVARLGVAVRVPRRRYIFRLYAGFNDIADAAFDRLWSSDGLTWADLAAMAEQLAAADTRPQRRKSLRSESLRRTITA